MKVVGNYIKLPRQEVLVVVDGQISGRFIATIVVPRVPDEPAVIDNDGRVVIPGKYRERDVWLYFPD